jgi:archaellum component FlaG (FlaF/FlaG flagellin family)
MQRRIFAGFVLIFIMSLLVGGAVAAYFSDDILLPPMADFQMAEMGIEVDKVSEARQENITIQSGRDTAKARWEIKNTGSTAVLLRAKLNEEYIDEIDTAINSDSASVSYRVKEPGIVSSKVSDGWEERDDGYFYYDQPVESGGRVEFDLEFTVDGSWWGTGELYLKVEAIQAANLPPGRVWPENTVAEQKAEEL